MIYKIKGILYYTSSSVIHDMLGDVFNRLTTRPRVFGYDITYSDSSTELSITTSDNSEKEYYVDIAFTEESKFLYIKEAFKMKVMEYDILFDLSFISESENSHEVIEEEEFSHPEFLTRYNPPKK